MARFEFMSSELGLGSGKVNEGSSLGVRASILSRVGHATHRQIPGITRETSDLYSIQGQSC